MRYQKAVPAGRQGFAPVLILGLVVVAGAVLFLISKYFGASKLNVNTPISSSSPLVTIIPTSSASPEISNWKTYVGETVYTTDGSTRFLVKYPKEWQIDGNTVYPFGEQEDKGFETRIILGAGGHGGFPEGETAERQFPSGQAMYVWANNGTWISAFATFEKDNKSYIIEIQNLPAKYDTEYKKIFDHLLSTFEFTN